MTMTQKKGRKERKKKLIGREINAFSWKKTCDIIAWL